VGEDLVGRPLRKGEVVHHKNSVRHDNDPANLEVMTVEAHRRHHWAELADIPRIPIDEDALRCALRTEGSVKGAARVLGIDHNVIRNRFPDLCAPFQRQSPTKIDDPRDLDRIAAFAADPDVGYREAATALKMSAITIQRICKRRGWVWQKKSRGPWPADDVRRENQRAIRKGLRVGEKLPAPDERRQP
jgi:hypothetical protein